MRRALGRALLAATMAVAAPLVPSAQQSAVPQPGLAREIDEAERLLKARKLDEATTAFQAAIDAAHNAGLEAEEARAQCGLGETLNARAQYGEARPILQQCLDAAERLKSEQGVGRALIALSQAAEMSGGMSEATAFAERAVAVQEARQD